jgi:hypothetical protein
MKGKQITDRRCISVSPLLEIWLNIEHKNTVMLQHNEDEEVSTGGYLREETKRVDFAKICQITTNFPE